MDFAQLQRLITVRGGQLVLGRDLLPGAELGALLDLYAGGLALTITGASAPTVVSVPAPEGARQAVQVTGQLGFLRVAAAPVTALFSLTPDGVPLACLRVQVLADPPGPAPWRFSTSFPGLPVSIDFGKPLASAGYVALDALDLRDGWLILATATFPDPVLAQVERGLSFHAVYRPGALLGLFEALVGTGAPLVLGGTIRLPDPGEVTRPLRPLELPWAVTPLPPGVFLDVGLQAGFQVQGLGFDAARSRLRLYSPPDLAWLSQHPTYRPTTAVTGWLGYQGKSGAPQGLDVAALLVQGTGQAVLLWSGDAPLSTGLSDLGGLVGGTSLLPALPPDVQTLVGRLTQAIHFRSAAVGFQAAFTPAALGFVALGVGFEGLTWSLFPDQDPATFEVGVTDALFLVTTPLTGPHAQVVLEGQLTLLGAPFDVVTTVDPFSVQASLQPDHQLKLGQLCETYLGFTPPVDPWIDTLSLSVQPGQGYVVTLSAAEDPAPWTIPVGPGLTVSSLRLQASYTPARGQAPAALQGSFTGGLALGPVSTLLRLDLPAATLQVRASLPPIRLRDVLGALLDLAHLSLPEAIDFELTDTALLIDGSTGGLRLNLATTAAAAGDPPTPFGLFQLVVQLGGGTTWGVAVGMSLELGQLGELPGLSALGRFVKYFPLIDHLLFTLSTLDDPAFAFPDLALFQAPALQGRTTLTLPGGQGVGPGLVVFARGTLTDSTLFGVDRLAKFFGLTLEVGLGIAVRDLTNPVSDTKLYAQFSGDAHGISWKASVGAQLAGDEVGLYGSASLTISRWNQPEGLTGTLLAVAVPTGVLVSGSVAGTITLGPLSLRDLAAEVGIDDAEVPTIGFAGTLDVAGFDAAVALLFNSAAPDHSVVGGAVSRISLWDVAGSLARQGTLQLSLPQPLVDVLQHVCLDGLPAFTVPSTPDLVTALDERKADLVAPALQTAMQGVGLAPLAPTCQWTSILPNPPGQTWFVTDRRTMRHYVLELQGATLEVRQEAQLYLAPASVVMGGLTFDQGFRVTGRLDLWWLAVDVDVELQADVGLRVDVGLEGPLVLSSKHPALFSLTDAAGTGGPQLSIYSYERPDATDPLLRPPHVYLTGKLGLLGLTVSAYVSVTTKGLVVDLDEHLAAGTLEDGYHLEAHLGVGGPAAFSASGKATLTLPDALDLGPLGKVPLGDGLQASGSFQASWSGGDPSVTFTLAAWTLQKEDFPALTLTLDADGLGDLWDTTVRALEDTLEGWFKADAQRWVTWVKAEWVNGVSGLEQVGQVLRDELGQGLGQVALLVQQVYDDALDVAWALYGATGGDPGQVAATLLTLSPFYGYFELAQALMQLFGLSLPSAYALLGDTQDQSAGGCAVGAAKAVATGAAAGPLLLARAQAARSTVAGPRPAFPAALEEPLFALGDTPAGRGLLQAYALHQVEVERLVARRPLGPLLARGTALEATCRALDALAPAASAPLRQALLAARRQPHLLAPLVEASRRGP